MAIEVATRFTVSVFVPSLLETTNSRLIAGTVRSRATLRFVARKAIDPRNCASVSVTLPEVKSTESWPHSAASSASNASLAVTSFCACELTMRVMLRLGVAMRGFLYSRLAGEAAADAAGDLVDVDGDARLRRAEVSRLLGRRVGRCGRAQPRDGAHDGRAVEHVELVGLGRLVERHVDAVAPFGVQPGAADPGDGETIA